MKKDPIISIERLKTKFGPQIVHQNLNLDVFPGEILGIVGGSGSGKSVLLRTILGLMPVQKGRITVFQKVVGSMEKVMSHHLQSHWGVLFQNGALFSSLTLGENIQIPMKELEKFSPRLAKEITLIKLKMVGLDEKDFHKYPSELSGGMVKRAALARALAVDPDILFLDEPTAGLDPIAAASFDDLILSLKKSLNLTVVLITHDLDTLYKVCDRIAVLVDKHAIVGTLEELMKNPHPWIQEYFHGARAKIAFHNRSREN